MSGTILIQSAHGILTPIGEPSITLSAPLPSFNPSIEELKDLQSNPALSEDDLRRYFSAPSYEQETNTDSNIAPVGEGDDPAKPVDPVSAPAADAPAADAPAAPVAETTAPAKAAAKTTAK